MKNTLSETWKIQALSDKGDMVELNPTIGGRRGSELAHKLISFTNRKSEEYYIFTGGNSCRLQAQKNGRYLHSFLDSEGNALHMRCGIQSHCKMPARENGTFFFIFLAVIEFIQ